MRSTLLNLTASALLVLLLVACTNLPTQPEPAPASASPQYASFPYRKRGSGLPSFAPLLRDIAPSVVNIAVVSTVSLEYNPLLRDPMFRRFLEMFELQLPETPPQHRLQTVGSGVIVDARRGYVITNHHVIEDAEAIRVTLKDRRSFAGQLLGSDPRTDIALLRIEPKGLVALPLGDSDAVEVGDFVLAIGNPFGLGQTVTSGIVSALGRSGVRVEGFEDFIQTDASINPGNSGGPLVNLAGEVVGINSAIIGPSGGNIGIGFAVPSNLAREAIERLVARQPARRR